MVNRTNKNYSPKEIDVIRDLVAKSSNKEEAFRQASKVLNRPAQGISNKYYSHIAKIKANPNVVITKEDDTLYSDDPLIKVKTRLTYEAINGEVFLLKEDAIRENVNVILNKMSDVENLHTFIVEHWDWLEYVKRNSNV